MSARGEDVARQRATDLLPCDRTLSGTSKFVDDFRVVAQVLFAADEDDGEARAKVQDFADPLFLNVVERIGGIDCEADEDDVRVWVRERAETVVVFLSGGIPQGEFDAFAVDHDIGDTGRQVSRGSYTIEV